MVNLLTKAVLCAAAILLKLKFNQVINFNNASDNAQCATAALTVLSPAVYLCDVATIVINENLLFRMLHLVLAVDISCRTPTNGESEQMAYTIFCAQIHGWLLSEPRFVRAKNRRRNLLQ